MASGATGSSGDQRRSARSEQTIERAMDDLRRSFRRIDALSRRVERVTGLTSQQLWALKTLRSAGRVDVARLARRMRLPPSTLGGVLDRLVGKGLVEWQRPRRAGGPPRASVTGAGDYLAASAPAVAQELLIEGLRRLSPNGLRNVSAGLHRLVHILGAEETPAQLLFSEEVNLSPDRRARRAGQTPDPETA